MPLLAINPLFAINHANAQKVCFVDALIGNAIGLVNGVLPRLEQKKSGAGA